MTQRIGNEEIIGEYRGFKQARKRTIQEQTETIESALYYPRGSIKKWLYKFWFWSRGMAQPVPPRWNVNNQSRINLKFLGKLSATDIVSGTLEVEANGVTLAILVPYAQYEQWKKVLAEEDKKAND